MSFANLLDVWILTQVLKKESILLLLVVCYKTFAYSKVMSFLLDANQLHCNVNNGAYDRGRVDRLGELKRQHICDAIQTRRPVIAFRRRR